MAWVALIISGVFEAVWATALGKSDGFTKPGPSVIFLLALIISMSGLAWAMRDLPIGTAHAVWVGIGAVLTVIYAMAFDGEPVSVPRLVLLAGIVGCVMGLKRLH